MIPDPITRTRYRTLQAALTLIGLLALGGSLTLLVLPQIRPLELAQLFRPDDEPYAGNKAR